MIGFGYDIHRLSAGESLVLGGIKIASELGTIAHSDGDVVLHALCDALLGAAGLGDIGEHFPDTDPAYKDADSRGFVEKVVSLLDSKGYKIVNIDVTILLEKPKISPYKDEMRRVIADLCRIPAERANVKATTNERLDAIGRGLGVAAWCICEIVEK